jgi:hypothetical protein
MEMNRAKPFGFLKDFEAWHGFVEGFSRYLKYPIHMEMNRATPFESKKV